MHLAQLLGPDLREALDTDPTGIIEALDEFHAEDIADLVEELPEDLTFDLMRVLDQSRRRRYRTGQFRSSGSYPPLA